jgi:hypothetical protein
VPDRLDVDGRIGRALPCARDRTCLVLVVDEQERDRATREFTDRSHEIGELPNLIERAASCGAEPGQWAGDNEIHVG